MLQPGARSGRRPCGRVAKNGGQGLKEQGGGKSIGGGGTFPKGRGMGTTQGCVSGTKGFCIIKALLIYRIIRRGDKLLILQKAKKLKNSSRSSRLRIEVWFCHNPFFGFHSPTGSGEQMRRWGGGITWAKDGWVTKTFRTGVDAKRHLWTES